MLKIALSRPPTSSPLAAVLIMYTYHLREKASRQTTSADVSVTQGSKAKFGESGLYGKRREQRFPSSLALLASEEHMSGCAAFRACCES